MLYRQITNLAMLPLMLRDMNDLVGKVFDNVSLERRKWCQAYLHLLIIGTAVVNGFHKTFLPYFKLYIHPCTWKKTEFDLQPRLVFWLLCYDAIIFFTKCIISFCKRMLSATTKAWETLLSNKKYKKDPDFLCYTLNLTKWGERVGGKRDVMYSNMVRFCLMLQKNRGI